MKVLKIKLSHQEHVYPTRSFLKSVFILSEVLRSREVGESCVNPSAPTPAVWASETRPQAAEPEPLIISRSEKTACVSWWETRGGDRPEFLKEVINMKLALEPTCSGVQSVCLESQAFTGVGGGGRQAVLRTCGLEKSRLAVRCEEPTSVHTGEGLP